MTKFCSSYGAALSPTGQCPKCGKIYSASSASNQTTQNGNHQGTPYQKKPEQCTAP